MHALLKREPNQVNFDDLGPKNPSSKQVASYLQGNKWGKSDYCPLFLIYNVQKIQVNNQ